MIDCQQTAQCTVSNVNIDHAPMFPVGFFVTVTRVSNMCLSSNDITRDISCYLILASSEKENLDATCQIFLAYLVHDPLNRKLMSHLLSWTCVGVSWKTLPLLLSRATRSRHVSPHLPIRKIRRFFYSKIKTGEFLTHLESYTL